MCFRARMASVAIVLSLASASVSFAQQPDTVAAVHRTGDKPGRASVGGQVGCPWFIEGGDYGKGAQPRMSFTGTFRSEEVPMPKSSTDFWAHECTSAEA